MTNFYSEGLIDWEFDLNDGDLVENINFGFKDFLDYLATELEIDRSKTYWNALSNKSYRITIEEI